ncbi:unnamed protein product [Cutaneotrichosporon oleaginosum]
MSLDDFSLILSQDETVSPAQPMSSQHDAWALVATNTSSTPFTYRRRSTSIAVSRTDRGDTALSWSASPEPRLREVNSTLPPVSPSLQLFSGELVQASPALPKRRRDADSSGTDAKGNVRWTPEEISVMLDIYEEFFVYVASVDRADQRQGATGDNGGKAAQWRHIAKKCSELYPDRPARNAQSCINKFGSTKRTYFEVKELLDCSGSGWDEEKCLVAGDDNFWNNEPSADDSGEQSSAARARKRVSSPRRKAYTSGKITHAQNLSEINQSILRLSEALTPNIKHLEPDMTNWIMSQVDIPYSTRAQFCVAIMDHPGQLKVLGFLADEAKRVDMFHHLLNEHLRSTNQTELLFD